MAKITLKTGKRSTSVKRSDIKKAVANAFEIYRAFRKSAAKPSKKHHSKAL